jgi:hypothetical protein
MKKKKAYYDEQKEKAKRIRDELFQDPGGGFFHIKDRETGEIKKFELPFVLLNPELNLWEGIRNDAIAYFEENEIEWHKDANGDPQKGPEGHLLSSNIACINHLFYLRQKKDLVTSVLKNIDSRIINAEFIDGGYVEFEVMEGKNKNPLNEKSKDRKRGEKSTSIDAIMVGKKNDGKNILVLIEWKYTESCKDQECKFISKDDYHKNYTDLLQAKDCPINSPENVMGLFFDPYYQLMRQTLLGWKMAELQEYGCDEYVHLHIIPHGNTELRNACRNWKTLLKEPQKYKIIAPDDLLKPLSNKQEAEKLLEYLKIRYW